jgi:photosystem II stability/assembly factor-like uncharacterized protein
MKLHRLAPFLLCSLAILSAQQVNPTLFEDMKWRLIGPFRGGRALTAVGVPGKPDLFYFGAVGGGVWKSTDAGTTWQPIFDRDSQNIASIGSLAVAPSDPKVIYVGTGEADMRSDITYGNGMYKSTDGGEHWQHIGLRDSRQIGKVIIDPHDPNRVFVAALGHQYGPNAERGVFRSTDGGASWQRVLGKDDETGAIDVAFSPSDPNVLYAAMWNTRRPPWNVYPPSNGPGTGFFKSTDGGNTWKQITQGLPSEDMGRIGIGVSPSDPKRVYLCVDAKQGGVYRSDDGGETFQLTDNDMRLWQRGWYFAGITVDPKNEDLVYVANTSSYISRDGGKTFEAFKGAPGGDDYHSIWISPENSDVMVIASDQGTIVTRNGGKTWSSWYNQPTGQFYHIITDNRFPYWVYGAQQDSGAMMLPSRSKFAHISEHDWRPLNVGGESGEIAPDPLDPNLLFGGTATKYFLDTAQEQEIQPTLSRAGTFRRTWTLPLVFSPADPHKLYVSHQFIYRSTDSGHSWQQISPDLTRENPGVPPNLNEATAKDVNSPSPRRGVVYAIAPSAKNANLIWAGTDDGLIHITRDDGKTWQNVTPSTLTAWSKVGVIEASHFEEGTAYAAIDRHRLEDYRAHILRTHDFGKTWQEVSTGIPDGSFVNVVREDKVRKGLLYAGTELGMYVSFDDGDHWQSLQLNLPIASVRDIDVHGDDLVVATHGRAFWILDDVTPLRELAANTAREPLHLFKPQVALRVRPSSDEGTPQPPETPKGDNPPQGAIIDYYVGQGGAGSLTLQIVDAKGEVVRHWSSEDKPQQVDPKSIDIPMYWFPPSPVLSAAPGMHRWLWDMHYAAPSGVSGRRRRSTGAGPWAPPGAYRVRLSYGGKMVEQAMTLKPDPRINAPQSLYDEQFATAMRAWNDAAKLAPALEQETALRKQLNELRSKAKTGQKDDTVLLSTIDQFTAKMEAAAGTSFTGLGPLGSEARTLRSVSGDLMAVASAVDSADQPITVEAIKALEVSEAASPQVLSVWQSVVQQLPTLNAELERAGLTPVKVERASR